MDYHTLAVNAWQYAYNNQTAIFNYLGAGGGIALLVQVIKKARKWDINNKDTRIQLALGAITALASTSDYVLSNSTQGVLPAIFGDMMPKLVVAAMIMHRIAVSPLTKVIEKRYANFVTNTSTKVANRVSVTGQITPHATENPVDAKQDVI